MGLASHGTSPTTRLADLEHERPHRQQSLRALRLTTPAARVQPKSPSEVPGRIAQPSIPTAGNQYSLPFRHKRSGRRAPFGKHVALRFAYSTTVVDAPLVASFIPRHAGPEPQRLAMSEFSGCAHDPGRLGIVPTFPIM